MGRVAIRPAGLRADRSFAEAGRQVIRARTDELFAHVEGVLDIDHPANLHDMRVATRRLRAGLEVFATCFSREEHDAVLSEVKVLADALGKRRDCDVQLELLAQLREEVTRSERVAIKSLTKQLHQEQRKANRRLARALGVVERNDLARRLQRFAA